MKNTKGCLRFLLLGSLAAVILLQGCKKKTPPVVTEDTPQEIVKEEQPPNEEVNEDDPGQPPVNDSYSDPVEEPDKKGDSFLNSYTITCNGQDCLADSEDDDDEDYQYIGYVDGKVYDILV